MPPPPPWIWRPAPHPPAPYPGPHGLRPLARLGQECHAGARSAFPRLGLRGEWSGPGSQSWRGERLPAPAGERGPLPASHAHPGLQIFQGASRGSTRIKAEWGGVGGDATKDDTGRALERTQLWRTHCGAPGPKQPSLGVTPPSAPQEWCKRWLTSQYLLSICSVLDPRGKATQERGPALCSRS